jgi:hypothetical protein
MYSENELAIFWNQHGSIVASYIENNNNELEEYIPSNDPKKAKERERYWIFFFLYTYN